MEYNEYREALELSLTKLDSIDIIKDIFEFDGQTIDDLRLYLDSKYTYTDKHSKTLMEHVSCTELQRYIFNRYTAGIY